ncbi:heavy-metal-associated domain-containing protein [Staphylococcus agnetis]|uniref:Heavy-metal-associated domain-containing protein n=1 Tax=Staphylococcus agnetis TaxID=985762 RepID=A0ABD7TW05_9STAP|nr:heavy-metal-associated domain-containing protein [Staphylococcus agnetis]UXU55672.1 heavy-metal-associated domain-containing protein [Staphylococcus agnetis]UXU57954.1 heavy-metal-associated domain-containing protein [Staphylococcus agnetis]UXU64925.1 heavy-metal-associated domain-containing protein [Staphylococcus agnetis]UXU67266.1 heavy-metal-associated domain-containing protein [Staphylococcus agnetis]
MQVDCVYVEDLRNEEYQTHLVQRLNEMIGVKEVSIDSDLKCITLRYETPINLNTLEKEIYDSGFKVLRTKKGEREHG